MDRQEARRIVSTEWVTTYKYVFNQLGFVEDEHARVRAANGFMVTIDKVLPFNAPVMDEPVPGIKTAKEIADEEKPAPPKTEGQGKIDDAPETVPGEKNTEEALLGPAYDPVTKTWKFCPHCKRTDITHISGENSRRPGSEYQACFGCRVYLNIDGKEKDMGPRGAKA